MSLILWLAHSNTASNRLVLQRAKMRTVACWFLAPRLPIAQQVMMVATRLVTLLRV